MPRKLPVIAAPRPPIMDPLEPAELPQSSPSFEGVHLQDVLDWPLIHDDPLQFDGCKVERSMLVGQELPRLKVWDSILVRTDISGARCFGAGLLRSEFIGCRLSGMQLGESTIKDVLFQQCKLNLLIFRACKLERVFFKDCILDEADFTGATLTDVVFSGCRLEQTVFEKTQCKQVDLSGCELGGIKGATSLKGARISYEQMMQLAPILCGEVGFVVSS